MDAYPVGRTERDRWIAGQRGLRALVSPQKPYGFFLESERGSDGQIVPVATVLLSNRECPWKCVMCDLWKNTLVTSVNPGAIPEQIGYALSRLGPARQVKLYNSGSFFDPGAIPAQDFPAIGALLRDFERVIVECHPALVSDCMLSFRDRLEGRLEVAMGLETAHPEVLQKLNKGMTCEQFAASAEWLRRNEIDLRTFILVQPPFLPSHEAVFWAGRSIDFAFENHARVAALIATRGGNGAMEKLEALGLFEVPKLQTLEAALEYGIGRRKGLVLADLWDLQKAILACPNCLPARLSRLEEMNLTQQVPPAVRCEGCRGLE